MKILHIITKGEIGGAQQVVLGLARQQKNGGDEVVVGFGTGEYLKKELQKSEIEFVNFTNLKRSANPLLGLFFIWEVKKYLQKNNFNQVHFHSSNTIIGTIIAKIVNKKIKTIFTFHGLSVLDPNYETNILKRIIFWLYFKFFLFFINEKIFVCNYNLEIAKKIRLVSDGKVVYNTLNANLNFFDKNEAQKIIFEKHNIDFANKFVIGSIGRLAYPKNYEFLINIFPEILKIKNNAIGIIIGDGPERSKYEKLVKINSLQKNIFFISSQHNAHQLLKAFDIFVLPSKYEGLSMTLLEAKAGAVPILTSNVGGSHEILEEKNLYTLDNKDDFMNKINKILFNSETINYD